MLRQRVATHASVSYRSAAKKPVGSSIFLPGVNVGRPRYGHDAQRKASPIAQLPQPPADPGFSSMSCTDHMAQIKLQKQPGPRLNTER